MTGLAKTESVMIRLDSPDQDAEQTVTFFLAHDDTGLIYRTLLIDYRDWLEMGSPEVITVTVEPGDRLNPS